MLNENKNEDELSSSYEDQSLSGEIIDDSSDEDDELLAGLRLNIDLYDEVIIINDDIMKLYL